MSVNDQSRHRDAAQAAWGADVPDWILILADECDRAGQIKVAKKLNCGVSTINEIVRKRYKARLTTVEDKVRGAFMGSTVQCPVLDEITVDLCVANQKRPFSAANPTRVALHKTCPTCPHNRLSRSLNSKPEESHVK